MKLLNRIIIGLSLLTALSACSEDKGNYDYRTLNTITIGKFEASYPVNQNDTLKIPCPELTFALEDHPELAFEWHMGRRGGYKKDRLISTERDCRVKITEPAGEYDCWLCVTDKNSDLKYTRTFTVKVISSYNALFILSEDQEGTARLSVQLRDKAETPLIYEAFEQNNPDFGTLGRKPSQLTYDRYTQRLFILCQEGERKLITLNSQNLSLLGYIDEHAVGSDFTGGLIPEYFDNCHGSGLVLSRGKLFLFNYMGTGSLYYPVPTDRYFTWTGANPDAATVYCFGYDEQGGQFVRLEKARNPLQYEVITPVEELNTQTGMTFLMAGSAMNGSDKVLYPVLFDPSTDTDHYYEIRNYSEWDPDTWETAYFFKYREIMSRPHTFTGKPVCMMNNANYWFVADGQKLVRYYNSGKSTAQDWLTGIGGKVTAMIFDNEQERIFAAAFDGQKSRIYEISAVEAGKQLREPFVVEGKVVSLCSVGENWTE